MILVTYDISETKLRTKFSKFLSKYGYRIQYSIFEIHNSEVALNRIQAKVEKYFSKKFQQSDSVLIFELSKTCKKTSYGYAKNLDEELIVF
jgi:CRISPR-associated protein Cas2